LVDHQPGFSGWVDGWADGKPDLKGCVAQSNKACGKKYFFF
jgi:hypothetical protein